MEELTKRQLSNINKKNREVFKLFMSLFFKDEIKGSCIIMTYREGNNGEKWIKTKVPCLCFHYTFRWRGAIVKIETDYSSAFSVLTIQEVMASFYRAISDKVARIEIERTREQLKDRIFKNLFGN